MNNFKINTLSALRFLLIIPAAITGWYLGLLLAMAIHELGEITCPAEYIVSGACFAPWTSSVQSMAMAAGACVAAMLIVLFAYWLAPLHKRATSLIVLSGGITVATIMVIMTKAWLAYFFALSGGVIAQWLLMRSTASATTD